MQPPDEPRKRLKVIEGGKREPDGHADQPKFGSGIRAEEAKDPRKPLSAEEIEAMRGMDDPIKG